MFALYKKEVQSYFYSPFAYIVSALFLLVFSLSFVYMVSTMKDSTVRFSFSSIFYSNFFYFIFMIPLLTMRTFAEERKQHTETLWLSAPITVPRVVIAKFLAVSTVYLMMIGLSLFFPLITWLRGSVVPGALLCGYAGFIMWGLVCIAVGIFCSALTDSPILAAVFGEGAMVVILFIDNLAGTGFVQSLPWLNRIVSWFSLQRRFVGFAQGLFGVADLVYFITITAVVLIWTVILVEKRRWSRA